MIQLKFLFVMARKQYECNRNDSTLNVDFFCLSDNVMTISKCLGFRPMSQLPGSHTEMKENK